MGLVGTFPRHVLSWGHGHTPGTSKSEQGAG